MNRLLLADAINRRPASSEYRDLLSSALKYGLTTGNEKSELISLTPAGLSITKPRDAEERARAVKRAAFEPELFRRIYERYTNGKLPEGDFFLTLLERDFNVPRDRCQQCAEILIDNGRFAGVIREMKDTLYVILEAQTAEPGTAEVVAAGFEADELAGEVAQAAEPEAAPPAGPAAGELPEPGERYIFIGHGKNRKPLNQLEKVLDKFKIAYKVAVDEPQMARPISVKVAEIMRQCHSAILIFTSDEQLKTPEDEIIQRPSENVIYELGAASVLYENRIVIFKEDGLDFPTNFHDIGHIPFEKDKLDTKGVELISELIALGLIKVQPA